MALDLSRLGFGIAGAVPGDVVRDIAPIVEQAGFRTFWINDTSEGDALAAIEIGASVTTSLRFATGVVAVDRRPVHTVIAAVHQRDVPLDRLEIGIGARAKPSPLTTVREAAEAIRVELNVPVIVGALGPRMRSLGARVTDGLLLNWLTPDGARSARSDFERDTADFDNVSSRIALYIRCAAEEGARDRMNQEIERYASFPAYAANFDRLGFTAGDAAVFETDSSALRNRLEQFVHIVDEPVVRAITGDDTSAAYVRVIDAVVGS